VLERLMEKEVPEIADNRVEIVASVEYLGREQKLHLKRSIQI